MTARRPSFGLDAPLIVAVFALVGLAGAGLLAVQVTTGAGSHGLGYWTTPVGLLTAGAMAHSSLRGKVRLRDRALGELQLPAHADVLDLGCGSGLMLLGATERAPRGRGTGIDLWRTVDQAGSNRDRCLANARLLGVAERVTLVDGDMADLPFDDASFDAVLACVSIHNIHERTERDAVIRHAARVLRPGGRLLIIDFTKTKQYAQAAREAGLHEVRRSGLSLLMYPPVRIVTAVKPTG
jgi:SAM-dependent methyltransferase